MIKYGDLVDYIKRNHVNWNTDLFDVLRGFFDEYSSPHQPSYPTPQQNTVMESPIQQGLIFPKEEFKEPEDGEYTSDDLFNLFNS